MEILVNPNVSEPFTTTTTTAQASRTEDFEETFSRLFGNLSTSERVGSIENAVSSPKTGTSLSQNLGNQQINGVGEQGFSVFGSGPVVFPPLTDAERRRSALLQSINASTQPFVPMTLAPAAAAAGMNGGTLQNLVGSNLVGSNPYSMNYGLEQVPNLDFVHGSNGYALNNQLSNGHIHDGFNSLHGSPYNNGTLLRNSSSESGSNYYGYNDEEYLNLFNLEDVLIANAWSSQKVRKVVQHDPTLINDIEPCEIALLATLKLGSLYLQEILKSRDPLYFKKIYCATLDYIFELMIHPVGNYVVSKLLVSCDPSQIRQIVGRIISQPAELAHAAKNQYGACSLQKLIKELSSSKSPLIGLVITALSPDFCSLMANKHGSHLIMRCSLKHMDNFQKQFLYYVAHENSFILSKHEHGCVSVNTLVDTMPYPDKRIFLLKIASNALFLSQDPYGNYVIQHLFKAQNQEVDKAVCDNLKNNFVKLSMQKFASNVVERCIESSSMMIPLLELIYCMKLPLLCEDPAGNYVIQKALKESQSQNRHDLFRALVDNIQPHMKRLQNHPIGRNVYRTINKLSSFEVHNFLQRQNIH